MKININHFVSILKTGKTLLYPTDTIWGLGCDATNQAAVEKIYSLKKRDLSKPLIALVADVNMLSNYVSELPENIYALLNSDVPTTLVYPKGKGLAKGVMAHNGSVAIRIPTAGFTLDLIKSFGKPIVSTSANISDAPVPGSFGEIDPEILAQVDEVVPLNKEKIARISSQVLQLMPDGSVRQLR
ncbi:MAG: threonylcarbamoyl-AMP synthase [Flavobacteriaceae bacterium]|nr:threonylcarbamoyl-AMP synthase [Flavobacteriaceae bacterium]|tara:strand:+ start:738 stop:1292 length:555 start_codon:yes stop_codon:yes gene_type:complete